MPTALVALRLPNGDQNDALFSLATDKDYPLAMFRERVFGNRSLQTLVKRFLLRGQPYYSTSIARQKPNPHLERYHGSPSQNEEINGSFANHDYQRLIHRSGTQETGFIGHEAAATLLGGALFTGLTDMPEYYRKIPIAIVGYGAAGVIATRSLYEYGFSNITIFERRQRIGGIWSEKSVHGGSRNNPRDLKLFNQTLYRAPGDGFEVLRILNKIDQYGFFNHARPDMSYTGVRQIIPGDLHHTLVLDDGTTREFALVINCCGLGSPRPISDPTKMIGPSNHVRAVRWQYPQLSYDEARDKMFIFVGLGNSTAEMMQIIQGFRRKHDKKVDYRILTHYPKEAIYNPASTVPKDGTNYRLFRDLSKPDLTSFQGDLGSSFDAYQRALKGRRIVTDVVEWDVKTIDHGRRHIGVRTRGDDRIRGLCDFDELYVMTGYQHTAKALDVMGLSYDKIGLYPHFDYDGEFMQEPPTASRHRLFKGYFGIGSILNSPGNRNSIVIPGMIFRAPDMMFGVIMRTAEYYHRQKVRGRQLAQTILRQIDPTILADYDIRFIAKKR